MRLDTPTKFEMILGFCIMAPFVALYMLISKRGYKFWSEHWGKRDYED